MIIILILKNQQCGRKHNSKITPFKFISPASIYKTRLGHVEHYDGESHVLVNTEGGSPASTEKAQNVTSTDQCIIPEVFTEQIDHITEIHDDRENNNTSVVDSVHEFKSENN